MTAERVGLLAATVIVAGGLGAGFALIGSPSHQRELALDHRRVEDLSQIAGAMHARFHVDDSAATPLPKTLPRDLIIKYADRVAETTDPLDHRPYTYMRESSMRYRLCATFALASANDGGDHGSWQHPAGMHCYQFDLTRGTDPLADLSAHASEAKKRATRVAS